jgi:hypothetical protein
MRDFDVLKAVLEEQLPSEERPIGGEELAAMLRVKSADIKARVLRRVGEEIQTYLIVLLIPGLVFFLQYGISARAIVGSLGVLAVIGLTIAALSYKEYQIRTLPMHGPLRDSLKTLVAAIDSMTRLYMAAYMISIAISVVLVEGFVVWRWGLGLEALAAVAAGIVFVAWCYMSGRAYLERIFGRYRVELANSLRELEGA